MWSVVGKVGYIINFLLPQPADPLSPDDVTTTENDYQWFINWLLHPVFSSTGDYTAIMRERMANLSRMQGFSMSRLPSFTKEQIRDVCGASDFLGIKYHTYELVTSQTNVDINVVNFNNDNGATLLEGVQYFKV